MRKARLRALLTSARALRWNFTRNEGVPSSNLGVGFNLRVSCLIQISSSDKDAGPGKEDAGPGKEDAGPVHIAATGTGRS